MIYARALLRDTRDGYEAWDRMREFDDQHQAEWVWLEGNYQCDCNRSEFLHDDEAKHLPCGDGTIELVSLEIGGVSVMSDAQFKRECDDARRRNELLQQGVYLP